MREEIDSIGEGLRRGDFRNKREREREVIGEEER